MTAPAQDSSTAPNAKTTRKQYPFDKIEARWQSQWLDRKAFRAHNPGDEGFDPQKPKFYVLDMFPYPSGSGLHVGHAEGYTATDIITRYKRMRGFNVLHPMGWDAFGLPAEQYAIKTGQHPRETTQVNVNRYREQLQAIGLSYDWDREINTTDPQYFRWTQWIFRLIHSSWFDPEKNQARPISELEAKRRAEFPEESPEDLRAFLDSKRLAFVSHQPVNWSPDLGTVLANEEVEEWVSKGHTVERRPLRQWMLRITDYAQRLIDDLDHVDWPDHVKMLQRNWIGRSEGAYLDFTVAGGAESDVLTVFTTRPDTLYGATYMVLAPEHPLVEKITTDEQREQVAQYQQSIASKSDLDRTDLAKDKTGVFTGGYAINPVNEEKIPIWIADYVLMGYGTGAIMAVPAHDERDFAFAKKFGIPIVQVVAPEAPTNRSEPSPRSEGVSPSVSPRSGGILPPPNFEGFREFDEISIKRGDYLPHWRKPGATYSVCFRLADSLPKDKLEEARIQLKRISETWENANLSEEEKQEAFSQAKFEWAEKMHHILDQGSGECVLKDALAAQVVLSALQHFHKDRYELLAWSVMPNHVHVVVKPEKEYDLTDIIQSWKSFTSKEINKLMGTSGTVWQSDFYNRIIRDEDELCEQIQYVLNNPLLGNGDVSFTGFNRESVPFEGEFPRRWGRDAPTTDASELSDPPLAPFVEPGFAVNSPLIEGLPTLEAKRVIAEWLEEQGKGRGAVNFKLRDWLFSRQRYWGEPFPIVWDEAGNHFCVSEEELPVEPPEMEDFKPTGTPEPPLSKATDWVKYSETARRETNTMPQWAGSCWYYLRYCDPHCDTAPISREADAYWMKGGVDLYIGGVEHAVLHLLYARFWHKILFDYGVVSETEPFRRLVNPGIVLGPDNQKMSKSRGNVVNTEAVIEPYGADSLRLFEMFIGPIEQSAPWSMSGVEGVHRFLARTWRLFMEENQEGEWSPNPAVTSGGEPTKAQLKALHQTIKKVTESVENLSFNTAISAMMVFVNEMTSATERPWSVLEPFLRLLSPFAPHLAEELWSRSDAARDNQFVMHQPWPEFDEQYLTEDEITMVIQVNGKVRDKMTVPAGLDKAEMETLARESEKVAKFVEDLTIRKVIVVPGKLVNIVAN